MTERRDGPHPPEPGTEYRVTLHRDGRRWYALLTYSRPGDTAESSGIIGLMSYVTEGRRWYRYGAYYARSSRRALLRAYRAGDKLTGQARRLARDNSTFEAEFATPATRPYVGTGPR